MRLSITLPSLFPDDLARTLDLLDAHTRAVDFEVVVVSPFEVKRPRVVWVREETPRGNAPAHAAAFAHATGDLVVAMSDDTAPVPGWDAQAMAAFAERERGHDLFCLGLGLSSRYIGTVFGLYYPFFPLARRGGLAAIGYYSDAYQAHFADSDLALRIWSAGGRCEFSERPLIALDTGNLRPATRKGKAMAADMATFVQRWAGRYGAGWDVSHLDGFLLDLNPLLQLSCVRERTVRLNTPRLKELYDNYHASMASCQAAITFPE
ncbi:MAG TPA: hypothetical protein VGB82_21750 [Alphaproteobacteria bacterium]